MIKILGPLEVFNQDPEVACSGGSDSMAVCDFLARGRKRFHPLFFNHGTETSAKAYKFLSVRFPSLTVGYISSPSRPKGLSWEEYWRTERLKFFRSRKNKVITGHNLDDAVETWMMSSCHGQGRLPFYDNGSCIRPFMLAKKEDLRSWCIRHDVEWIEDETNQDVAFKRNFARKELIPAAIKINPGIYSVIRRKLVEGLASGELVYKS